MQNLLIRPATDADLPFFYSATLQSNFYSSPSCRRLLPSIYYPEHKECLARLLLQEQSRLLIACLNDSPEVILGFAFGEPGEVLHYIYVKRAFRFFGIARKLLESLDIDLAHCEVSHWTEDLAWIAERKRLTELVFNPYLLVG